MNESFIQSTATCAIQSILKSQIDSVFQDIIELTTPVFQPRSLIQGKLCPEAGKQVFYPTSKNILRYDHTNVLLNLEGARLPATRTWGPVFRNGPRSSMRWKEFLQYDIDGMRSVYGTTLIERGLTFLKQIDPHFYVKVTGFENQDWPLESVSVALNRDQTYYSGPVFEVFHPQYPCAFMAGGVYYNNSEEMIGFSFGVTRLAKFILDQNKLVANPVVACYVKMGNSSELSEAFGRAGVRLIPIPAKKNLRKDVAQLSRNLAPLGYFIKNVIIHGQREDREKTYIYKPYGKAARSYSIEELVSEIKSTL